VIVLGDESGYTVTESQQTKLAAMEAIWETHPAPAPFTLFALPDEDKRANHLAVEVPYVMGLIGTRTVSKEIPGLNEIEQKNAERIERGIFAVKALERLRKDRNDAEAKAAFDQYKTDLGFGLLLKAHVDDVARATPAMILAAAADTTPRVAPMFWSFRLMVALGFSFMALFTLALYYSLRNSFEGKRWLLRWALWFIPMPWVAAELGWFVAEYGRQPWTIFGVLPTHLSVSSLTPASLYGSLAGFIGFYTLLLIAELHLMLRFARQGPSSLGTGRYHDEGGGAMPAAATAAPRREF
jgi:cytochrome d ubiquinol oxidase subunit I